jgi:hypothetical protein
MDENVRRTDVSGLPDVLRLAGEVHGTKEPQILERNGQDIAVLSPVAPPSRPAKRAKGARARAHPNDWLLNLIGIADDSEPPDGPTDVSSNKHHYLAEAYYSKSHPPSEQ